MLKKLSLVAISLFALGAFSLVSSDSTVSAQAQETCPNTGSGWTKYDDWADDKKTQSHTASAGQVVVEVCVKGSTAVEYFTANGTKSCWIVAGIGTQTASATENWPGDDKDNSCHDISHASFRVAPAPVDFCDPSKRPRGKSIDQWLTENQIDRADCFAYEVTKRCGFVDVDLTRYPIFLGKPYDVVYATNGSVVLPAKSFPAQFAEDENGGSVNVTWFIVGPEPDYLKGTTLPNFWAPATAQTITVDTDCKRPEGGSGGYTPTPETPKTPETPVATTPMELPNTSGASTPVVVAGAASIAVLILVAAAAVKSRFVL